MNHSESRRATWMLAGPRGCSHGLPGAGLSTFHTAGVTAERSEQDFTIEGEKDPKRIFPFLRGPCVRLAETPCWPRILT